MAKTNDRPGGSGVGIILKMVLPKKKPNQNYFRV